MGFWLESRSRLNQLKDSRQWIAFPPLGDMVGFRHIQNGHIFFELLHNHLVTGSAIPKVEDGSWYSLPQF